MEDYSLVPENSLTNEESYKTPLTSELAGGQLWWQGFSKALPVHGGQHP